MDLWGNVKIPYISRLDSPADEEGWHTITTEADPQKYSSLIGVPVYGIRASRNVSFTMETTHFNLDCYEARAGEPDFEIQEPLLYGPAPGNGTFWGIQVPNSTFSVAMDSLMGSNDFSRDWRMFNETRRHPHRTLLLRSWYKTQNVYCHTSTEYVESAVNCTGLACAVTRTRASRAYRADPNAVLLGLSMYFYPFSSRFPLAVPLVPQLNSPSATEFYLRYPMEPFSSRTYRTSANISAVPLTDLSIRLG